MIARKSRAVAILAGGRSSRMRKDKALLSDSSGQTWIEKTVSISQGFTLKVLLITGASPRYEHLFSSTELRIVPDDEPELGPLGGICTALRQERTPYIYFLTCDMPTVSLEIFQQLGIPKLDEDVLYTKNTFFPMVVQNTSSLLQKTDDRLKAGKY